MALSRCFGAVKEFLDIFLSLPIAEYRNLAFAQWSQLIEIFKIVPKLCFHNEQVPMWDAFQARKDLRFGTVLESLCYRMHELASGADKQAIVREVQSHNTLQPDGFSMYKSVLQVFKDTYDAKCRAADEERPSQLPLLRCPVRETILQHDWAFDDQNTMFDDFSMSELDMSFFAS